MKLHAEKQPGVPRAAQAHAAARALLLAGLLMCCAAEARADCTGPSGAAGSMVYNEADSGMYFCQSTTWVALAGSGPWARSSTNDLYYTAGNVAIGSTTPSTGTGGLMKLDVEGPLGATKFCDKDGNNCFTAGGGGGSVVTGTGTLNYITKWTGTGSLGNSLLFDNGTNVGIGTATPGALLEVTGAGNKSVLVNWTATAATPSNLAETRNFYAYAYAPMRAANPYGMYITHFSPGGYPGIQGVDSSDAANAFLLQPYGGNVGIGTASPSSRLDIADGVLTLSSGEVLRADSGYVVTDGDAGFMVRQGGSNKVVLNGTSWRGESDNTIDLGLSTKRWRDLWTNGLTVTGGNVGIGDSTPDSGTGGQLLLDVEGPVGATKFCDQGGNNCFTTATVGGGVSGAGSGTANYIAKWTSGSAIGNSIIYDNGTNVGIGTAGAASYKLQAQGDIYANGGWLRVSGNSGLYFESWGGGWNMTDGTWIRSYNAKPVYMAAGYDSAAASGVNCGGGLGGGYTFQVCGSTLGDIFYDRNNAAYYLDPASTSITNDMRAAAFYYKDNTAYGFIGASVYADTINTGSAGDPLELNYYRAGDIRFTGGDQTMALNRLVYPGSNSGLTDYQKSYYLASNASYGLYTNTSMYFAGGTYAPARVQATIFYDWDNTGYYVDPNGSSYTNYFGRNYGFNWTEYDWNNSAYYVDPNNTSIYNDLRANIFYDYGNTGYYVDPNGNSRVANVQTDAVLLNWPGYNGVAEATGHYIWPGSYDRAWQQSWYLRSGPDWGLYTNTSLNAAGSLYSADALVLVRDRWLGSNYYGSNGDMYLTWKSKWLSTDLSDLWAAFGNYLTLNTWQSNHYSGSDGAEYATIFYDTNNSGYYSDPNGVSRLNDVRPNIIYDPDNTGYYIDINSTSRMNEIQADRVYGFSDIRSPIFYDYNNTGYYLNPDSTSHLWRADIHIVYPDVMFDMANSGYYIDMNATSRINYMIFDNAYSYGWMQASAFYYASDKRLKENIRGLENGVDLVRRLRPVRYEWKRDHSADVGFIAQEVEGVLPELVKTDSEGMKSLEYGKLMAVLTAAVQTQQEEIERQNARIEELERRLSAVTAPGR